MLAQSRREKFERFRIKQKQQSDLLSAMVELESSSSGDEDFEDAEVPITTASSSRKRKRPATNIVTQDIAAALDRTQVSDRKAVFILTATASSL